MPRNPLRLLTVAISAAVLAGCVVKSNESASSPPAKAGRDCFNIAQVSGFSRASEDRVYVHTGPNEVWLFDTFGYCPDLEFTEKLALHASPSSWVCRGIDVDLIVPSVTGPRRCPVRMIQKISEAEARAL